MVQLDNLMKSYRKQVVLKNISTTFVDHATTCIIGENGSGKSTLLALLAGLLAPDSGEVLYDGLPPREASVSLLPQQDQLFANLSVKDNLDFWAAAAGLSFSDPQVTHSISLLNLGQFLDKKIAQLSGGMRRRVAIATAVLPDPDYLLLDEPFSGLDLNHKLELRSYFSLLSTKKTTIIYTAHNIDEIYRLADHLLLMEDGNLWPLAVPNSMDALHHLVTASLNKGGQTND